MAAYYNEHDQFAAQWLRNLIAAGHLPPGDVDTRSILDVQPEDLRGYVQCHFFAGIGIWGLGLRRIGWPDDRPIWTGSCPCQPFSAAGGRLGFVDERHLWPAWFHLFAHYRPAVIVGEQVASKDGLGWLDLVSTDLENAGYAVGATDLCAAGVGRQEQDGVRFSGGAHIRQRLYFVGLAHPEGERRGEAGGELQRNGQAEREYSDSAASGLGDPRGEGLAQRVGDRGIPRGAGGTSEGQERTRAGNPTSRVADDRSGRREMALQQPGNCGAASSGGQTSEFRGNGDAVGSGVADADKQGIGGWGISGREQSPSPSEGPPRERLTGLCADSGYSGADRGNAIPDYGPDGRVPNLVYCRDGRWRPVEPGTFPLAYAVPRNMAAMRPELLAVCNAAGFGERDLKEARQYRAGALKAFGNALDTETVATFLAAVAECAP